MAISRIVGEIEEKVTVREIGGFVTIVIVVVIIVVVVINVTNIVRLTGCLSDCPGDQRSWNCHHCHHQHHHQHQNLQFLSQTTNSSNDPTKVQCLQYGTLWLSQAEHRLFKYFVVHCTLFTFCSYQVHIWFLNVLFLFCCSHIVHVLFIFSDPILC